MADRKLLHCYNRGCGQSYDPDTNKDDSCRHHPGAPFFHDAYKGWSCCNKKSVDFTEFLNIKGCTLSKHSNVKPPEPEKPAKREESPESKDEVIVVREPIKEAMPRPPVDSPLVTIEPSVAPALREAIAELEAKKKAPPSAQKAGSLGEGEVAIGTTCKHRGCDATYTGDPASDCDCRYHPGVAVFHEGMKFWSCCQKKTTDFTEFMAQKGCAYGQHQWLNENGNNLKEVKCRYDWHQTAKDVIVTVYAKMNQYAKSKIEVNPIRLRVYLVFPEKDNASFEMDLELRGIIDVSQTKVHMSVSKVEITMPKAEPGSWSKLDFPLQGNQKLPPPSPAGAAASGQGVGTTRKASHADSDDDFNLDDIESVSNAFTITDISGKGDGDKNQLD